MSDSSTAIETAQEISNSAGADADLARTQTLGAEKKGSESDGAAEIKNFTANPAGYEKTFLAGESAEFATLQTSAASSLAAYGNAEEAAESMWASDTLGRRQADGR